MTTDLQKVFVRLREILRAEAATLQVTADNASQYCLEASPGPATLRAWGGTLRRPSIPIAWTEARKSYVSYHLMGLEHFAGSGDGISAGLKARMQGKTCFNFSRVDDDLFEELARLTSRGVRAMTKAGFITTEDA